MAAPDVVLAQYPILESCEILMLFCLEFTGKPGVFPVAEKAVRPAVSPSINRRNLPFSGCFGAVV